MSQTGITATPRGDCVRALLRNVRSFIFDQINLPNRGQTERDTSFKLMTQLGHVDKDLAAAGSDDAVRQIERERLRPVAQELRRFGLRTHLTLAKPLWGWPNQAVNPNSVSFTGGEELRRVVESVCRERELNLAKTVTGGEAGSLRWNQLRQAPVGVFDLTVEDRQARGQVCHALGTALALGVFPVVVAREGTKIPFNIDVDPTGLPPNRDVAGILGDAVDEALYRFLGTSGKSSVDATTQQVIALAEGSDAITRVLKPRLAEGSTTDPLEICALLGQLLGANDQTEMALLLPVWPGFYPHPGEPRCFHVMPFGEDWSDSARASVRAACERAGVAYRRGDETEEIQIIRSIWEEICRAKLVVVDLTGTNANVCLELGLAQALGRPTLLLRRGEETPEEFFPEIRKLQTLPYEDAQLTALVAEHLGS